MPKNKNLSKITSYLTADTDNGILSSNVSQTITGSLTVTGNLTAQQFIVSSSVTYLTQSFASGSHKFGNSSDDTHQFTGSVFMSNSLGIGTNSPNFNNFGTALTLVANSGYAGVEVYGSGSLNGGQIDFGSGIIRYASISGEYESATNGFLNIRTRKAETMTDVVRITSAGNVGIGTTSPGSKLAINAGASGGLRIDTNSTYNAISIGGTGIFSVDAPGISSGRLIVLDNGNTGIGTPNPSTKLHIYEPLTNTSAYLTIQNNRARNAGVYTQTTNGGFYAGTSIGTDTFNYQIYDGVAGAARLTISSTGAATFASTVTTGGQLITSAGQTGGYVAASSGYVNETQTVSTNGTSYYLYKYTGNANGSSSTIFNITGMSTTNGTYADIYAVAQKDATGNAINTNLEVQINGQYMVGIQAGGTSANTVRNAFRVCRMDGSWIIIGTVRT